MDERIPKFVLVNWIYSNSVSILSSKCILDDRMFYDSNLIGKVQLILDGTKQPNGGWSRYDARILSSSGNGICL